jgi:primosomal replication protein N
MLPDNWLTLCGELTHIEPARFTPAGIAIVEAVLLHRSEPAIGGVKRRVECELTIQASARLAEVLGRQKTGTQLRVQGVMNRRSLNSRQLILLLNELAVTELEKE